MYIIALAAKLALAMTLIAAGSAKLADIGQFASTVRLFLPRGLALPPAGKAVPPDRAVPPDKAVPPDRTMPPDKAVPPDRTMPPDKAVPPDRAVAGLIAVAELAVGCASLAAPRAGWVNWVVLGIGIAFIAISAVGYARYRNRSCNCFGGLSRRKFDRRGIARSLVIAAGGGVATLPVPATAVRLSAIDGFLLLAAAVLASCATFAAARAVAVASNA
jgi:hypothetical protein